MLVLVSFARGRQFMDHSDHMCSTVVRPGQTERDSNAVIKSEAELGCCVRVPFSAHARRGAGPGTRSRQETPHTNSTLLVELFYPVSSLPSASR